MGPGSAKDMGATNLTTAAGESDILTAMETETQQAPWYVAGLAFDCAGCGRCCAGPDEGYVWATEREIAAIATHLELAADQMRRQYVRKVGRRHSLVEMRGSHDCVFLTGPDTAGDRTCRIYPVRPRQCRTWPFWANNVSDPDAWTEAGQRCRGINRGTLVPVERIYDQCGRTRQ